MYYIAIIVLKVPVLNYIQQIFTIYRYIHVLYYTYSLGFQPFIQDFMLGRKKNQSCEVHMYTALGGGGEGVCCVGV